MVKLVLCHFMWSFYVTWTWSHQLEISVEYYKIILCHCETVLCHFHVCTCFCSSSGVPAMCTAHLHPVLCSERHGSHRPHVPVLPGCLHWALHHVHWEEPAQLQTGGTYHQPQRLPHLCCLQVNKLVRLLVSSALFAAKLACLQQTCLCQDFLTCVLYQGIF